MSWLILFLIAISPFVGAQLHCHRHRLRSERRKAVQAFYTRRLIAHSRHGGSVSCPCAQRNHRGR